jgi:hypothetical protein
MNKKREYSFVDIIDVGQFNARTLRAISVKLSKDYLGFFGKLEKLYLKRKQGEIVLNTIHEIKQTLHLLDGIIMNEKVSKEDAKILVDSINRINEDKNYFLEQVQNDGALTNELAQVSEATGISPDDLNITENIVKKGVKQARTSPKKKMLSSVFRGAMPATRGLASNLAGGLGVAALGPLAPIANMGWGMMKDVFGLGRRLGNFAIERSREKQERQLSRTLRPAAYNASSEMLGGLSTRRGVPPFVKEFSGGREFNPLVDFFDRKAYKTKWTKEVLKSLKDSEKNSKSFGQKLGDFFTGIIGIGATLLGIAATLIAAGLAIANIYELVKKILELREAGKEEKEAGKGLVSASVKFLKDVDKRGLSDKQINALGRTGGRAGIGKDIKLGMKTEMEGAVLKEHPWLSAAEAGLKYVPFVAAGKWIRGKALDEMISEKVDNYMDAALVSSWKLPSPIQKPLPPSSVSPEMLKTLGLIPKTLKNVAEQIGNQKDIAIRRAGEGNMHDSSDVLLNNFIQGNLTLE